MSTAGSSVTPRPGTLGADFEVAPVAAALATVVGVTGCSAALYPAAGSAPIAAGAPMRPLPEDALSRLRSGAVSVVRLDADPVVQGHAIGEHPPHPVVVLSGAAHLADKLPALIGLVTMMHRVEEVEEAVLRALLAIFQLLVSGDVGGAQRAVQPLHANLLDAELARTWILRCADRAERRATTRRCRAALGDRGLVVECPVYPRDIIVVLPEHGGDARRAAADDGETLLRAMVEALPRNRLGGSPVLPLERCEEAYRFARRALATCEGSRRVSLHEAHDGLADVLDGRSPDARHWAARVLAPLRRLPDAERRRLTRTIETAALFPSRAAAARLLGVHRQTVTRNLARAGRLLAADLQDDLAAHAIIRLALAVSRLHDDRLPLRPRPVTLALLLADADAGRWADQLLAPVNRHDPELVRTLRSWLAHRRNDAATARALGVHASTVTARTQRASRLLGRELHQGDDGSHDLVLALHIRTGEPAALPDPAVAVSAGG